MPDKTEADLRREIVEFGRRVYDRFLVAANDGNISARLDDEAVLVTPTGVSKGFMSADDIVKVRRGELDEATVRQMVRRVVYRIAGRSSNSQPDTSRSLVTQADVQAVPVGGRLFVSQGALVTPLARQTALERQVTLEKSDAMPADQERRASSETLMHMAIYRARADVGAVIHTHAPAATAFAATAVRLDEPLLPEVLVGIGPVALVPYARSGTLDLPQAMAPYLANHDAFLLANHGTVTVGRTLEEAFFRTERLELFARIRLAALSLGATRPLPPEEVARLTAVWETLR
jgi:ribulose-5-phosphate 4-epimerase/fuculose-1-phosphate aldolase